MNMQRPEGGIIHKAGGIGHFIFEDNAETTTTLSPSTLVILFCCKDIRSRFSAAYFTCSYSESIQHGCSQVLKGLIPPVKQRSLRQPEPALLCYICRVYPRTSINHLLQEQPRRNQTAQSAADFNLMKQSDTHQIVKVWDGRGRTGGKGGRHANYNHVFIESTVDAEKVQLKPGGRIPIEQLEHTAVQIKAKVAQRVTFTWIDRWGTIKKYAAAQKILKHKTNTKMTISSIYILVRLNLQHHSWVLAFIVECK